jgi:hypothetical protein
LTKGNLNQIAACAVDVIQVHPGTLDLDVQAVCTALEQFTSTTWSKANLILTFPCFH